jgi:Domain of unknown function (DUF4279)
VIDEALPHVWISFDLVALERAGASFDPDYVTEQLGVQPTQQNRAGDPIRDGKGRRTFTRWRVSVGPVDTLDIAPMLSEVMARLSPANQKLRAVCVEIGVEPKLTCAVEPRSAQTPDVTFPREVVHWAAEYGVTLGVDVMLWRKDEDVEQDV